MPLTPDQLAAVRHLATVPSMSMTQAKGLKAILLFNTYIDPHQVKWWPHHDDQGVMVTGPDLEYITTPIKHVERRGAPINPDSLNQRRPWDTLGMSKSAWYAALGSRKALTPYMHKLPLKIALDKQRSLKLYRLIATLAHEHELDLNGLWGELCGVLHKYAPNDPGPVAGLMRVGK